MTRNPEQTRNNWKQKVEAKMNATFKAMRGLKALGRGRYKPSVIEKQAVLKALVSEIDSLSEAWTPGDPAPATAIFKLDDE